MVSECQKLAVRLFRRPEKAVQRNFFLEFSEIGSVNIIRDIGDIDGIQLQNPKQCMVKGILGARPFSGPVLFRLVKPFLYDFNIVITEILPEQFVDYFSGLSRLIFLHKRLRISHRFLHPLQNPQVGRKQHRFRPLSGPVILQMH